MKLFTVKQGKKSAKPFLLRSILPSFNKNKKGWIIELDQGWDYILPTNQTQWVKLCGITFNPFNRSKNSILLGARYTPNNGIEVTPYYNVDSLIYTVDNPQTPDHLKADWPVLVVDKSKLIYYAYKMNGNSVTTTIINGENKIVHRFVHEGISCMNYEVNFYFGGSVPAPQNISISKSKLKVLNWDTDDSLKILNYAS